MSRSVDSVARQGKHERFETHVVQVLRDLQEAFLGLIEGLPRPAPRAADLEKALGVSRTLGWQIHRLATAPSPLEAGGHVPGAEAVGQVLRGARAAGVADNRIARAAEAMKVFESFVERHAGDRALFETMIGSLTGESTETMGVKLRRQAFRVHSQIWGMQVKTFLASAALFPGKDSDHQDIVTIRGMHEIKRLRRGMSLLVSGQQMVDCENRPLLPTERIEDAPGPGPALLREFCSEDLPELESVVENEILYTFMRDSPLGNTGVKTIFLSDVTRDMQWRPKNGTWAYIDAVSILKPTERLVIDTMIHKDMYGVLEPTVRVYGSLRHLGVANPYGYQDDEVLPVKPDLRYCGRGPGVLATPHVPRYREMVESVLGRTGLDPEAFDLYRCTLEYPLLSTMVQVKFDLPEQGGW